MKFLVAIISLGLVGYGAEALDKCYAPPSGGGPAEIDQDCSTKCLGPIFDGSTETGLSSQTQACAATADTECEESDGCKSCTEDNCNTLPEVEDYMCSSYTLEDTTWTAGNTKVTCKKAKGTHGECKTPKETAVAGDASKYTAYGVCMKCATDDANCKTVSSARALASFVLPIIAFLYALF